ncbi:transketolase, partial [Leifsonia sp. SIMBA_070]
IAIYDSNQISIEGDTNVAFTEDVAARYESYGWQVLHVDWTASGEYVEDVAELNAAIEAGKAETGKPTLIVLKTLIGY